MDIFDYVRKFIPSQGEDQFAVLAFDLNLSFGKHRPPPLEPMQSFTVDPRQADSVSGPWCSKVVNFDKSPSLKYLAQRESFEHPGHIHPEELLLHFLPQYLTNFFLRYGAMPQSVCLYSLYSPCERCNKRLRPLPSFQFNVNFGTFKSVENWLLAFERPYSQGKPSYDEVKVSNFRELQLSGDDKALHSQYPNPEVALERAKSLSKTGWSVVSAT